tara:strand:- start:37412 stop:38920 length:1509 start_codon:yes stop_codon:yes gene_type:complete
VKDFLSGFPDWTELGQDSGLDPLGMQRPIEALFQSLIPGISTITLRFRYYSFFAWILEAYAKNEGNTDPSAFRVFQRRCETLFALISCSGEKELGIAGSDWATIQLRTDAEFIDFANGADPDADEGQRYLRNKGGAFGGIYSTQMAEMGLLLLKDPKHQIPVCTSRALPLAETFTDGNGELPDIFFNAVKNGRISKSELDRLHPLKPSSILLGSAEHEHLTKILLGEFEDASTSDVMRRRTMLMLLRLTDSFGSVPPAEEAKWDWYSTSKKSSPDAETQNLWALYQASDLMRLAYESILHAALSILRGAPSKRVTLDGITNQLVEYAQPKETDWGQYCSDLRAGQGSTHDSFEKMRDSIKDGSISKQIRSTIVLISSLIEKAQELASPLETALNAADYFQSLRTEVSFLNERSNLPARDVLYDMISSRILKRHLWVASRKFRHQKAYTFLMEPEDGQIRYRNDFTVAPSSPRITQALRFLEDMKLIDEHGLTDYGRAAVNRS